MDWFLYDNGLRHERVKKRFYENIRRIHKKNICAGISFLIKLNFVDLQLH